MQQAENRRFDLQTRANPSVKAKQRLNARIVIEALSWLERDVDSLCLTHSVGCLRIGLSNSVGLV